MLTIRRSVEREQKNVADVDENSLMIQPPSIQASIAVMNTRVRLAPATNGRDSMMVPCMLRTTYQRGADVGSSGLKAARRGLMFRKYSARRSRVHPVFGDAEHWMEEFHQRSPNRGVPTAGRLVVARVDRSEGRRYGATIIFAARGVPRHPHRDSGQSLYDPAFEDFISNLGKQWENLGLREDLKPPGKAKLSSAGDLYEQLKRLDELK
jgi:hypothetical protein